MFVMLKLVRERTLGLIHHHVLAMGLHMFLHWWRGFTVRYARQFLPLQ